jgi:glycosyltransferase involved in cell wall biosynthesis
MRALFDITTLANIYCSNASPAGIFRHVEEWAKALVANPDTYAELSCAPSQCEKALKYLTEAARLPASRFPLSVDSRLSSCLTQWAGFSSPASSRPRERQGKGMKICYNDEYIANNNHYDLWHINWKRYDELPSSTKPRIIQTIFDLIAIKRPEFFGSQGAQEPLALYLTKLLKSVRRQHRLIVSSSHVAEDILHFFPSISREQIFIVPLGVSPSFSPVQDKKAITNAMKRWRIPTTNYILTLNTLEPRKNIETVLKAYKLLISEGQFDDLSLVLVGAKGWHLDEVETLKRKHGLDSAKFSVIATGYVPDTELPALYSGASVFCYLSYEEGFGLPPLEAMKCGVPVVTSDRSSLPEVVGEAGICVDPQDAASAAAAVACLLTDPQKHKALRAKGFDRATSFSWQNSISQLIDAYKCAL